MFGNIWKFFHGSLTASRAKGLRAQDPLRKAPAFPSRRSPAGAGRRTMAARLGAEGSPHAEASPEGIGCPEAPRAGAALPPRTPLQTGEPHPRGALEVPRVFRAEWARSIVPPLDNRRRSSEPRSVEAPTGVGIEAATPRGFSARRRVRYLAGTRGCLRAPFGRRSSNWCSRNRVRADGAFQRS